MAAATSEFERFVVDTFDSEEAVMALLAVRSADEAVTPAQVREALVAQYGLDGSEERRVAEKRIELRLRDLAAAHLVEKGADGRFRFDKSDAQRVALVDRVAAEFASRRGELNRLLYSPAAVARRVAEAFKL